VIEHKIVNLDDMKKTVEITIGGKVFEIWRITNQMRALYGEYLQFCGKYLIEKGKLDDALANPNIDLETLEGHSITAPQMVIDFALEKSEHIKKMLKIILDKNGHEYKEEWWQDNTDFSGMEAFIVQALKKDEDDSARVAQKKEMAS
jgi:hypothetical protein